MSDTPNVDGDLLVMIVDDDPDDCFFHERAVRKAVPAVQVVTMHDADEALAYLRGGSPVPALILLDINMPRKSGWDFLDELERLAPSRGTGTVVIMLTSSQAPGDIRRADLHPLVTELTTKPLDDRRFKELLADRFPR